MITNKSLFVAVLMLLCCFSNSNIHAQNNQPANLEQLQLPLPEVPQDMTEPQERATYILEHFWDAMDFNDTQRSHDTYYIEVNFVNFISLFPHAEQESLPHPISTLLERAEKDSVALNTIMDLAEKYLYDPGSPARSEDYYIIFLEELLRLPDLPKAYRIRPTSQLKTAKKNRPGTVATDFKYTTSNGEQLTLHTTECNLLLLIFYDPACPHCVDILKEVDGSLFLKQLISDKVLSVLAIYTEGNRELWDESKSEMPETWAIGIDESGIVKNDIYDLPAMPIMYLLDKDKNVLLKDPTQNAVELYLSDLMINSR